ncbi:hypothetical protein Tco_0277957 [Tanacetum coccineum]
MVDQELSNTIVEHKCSADGGDSSGSALDPRYHISSDDLDEMDKEAVGFTNQDNSRMTVNVGRSFSPSYVYYRRYWNLMGVTWHKSDASTNFALNGFSDSISVDVIKFRIENLKEPEFKGYVVKYEIWVISLNYQKPNKLINLGKLVKTLGTTVQAGIPQSLRN